mmetsp:Transcript_19306/g.31610  ORF Transcript_19306/g.31610 Transcript_19306/m.31610 type:complete len:310 (-) Transcript_19306:262-1191(-)
MGFFSRPLGPLAPQVIGHNAYNNPAVLEGNWQEDRLDQRRHGALVPIDNVGRLPPLETFSRVVLDDGFRVYQTTKASDHCNPHVPKVGVQYGAFEVGGGVQPAPCPDTSYAPDDGGGPQRKRQPCARILTVDNLSRELKRPDFCADLSAVLPRHTFEYDKRYLESTSRYTSETGLGGIPSSLCFGKDSLVPGGHATYHSSKDVSEGPPAFGRNIACGATNWTVFPNGKRDLMQTAATLDPSQRSTFRKYTKSQDATADIGNVTVGAGFPLPRNKKPDITRGRDEEWKNGGMHIFSDADHVDRVGISQTM